MMTADKPVAKAGALHGQPSGNSPLPQNRPSSTDRPHAPANAMSPSQGLNVLGGARGFQAPQPGHSPRPESRPKDEQDLVSTEDAANLICSVAPNAAGDRAEDTYEQEFDLMLQQENENFSHFLASGSNTVNAPVMVEIRGKLAAAKLAAGQPRAQKPPAILPVEMGMRVGAGNPMGFESPSAASASVPLQPMLTPPVTPMPRNGASTVNRITTSVCNFCGSAMCTGQCPRGRDVSPLMASAVPLGVIVSTPSGGHAFGNPSPLQQPGWVAGATSKVHSPYLSHGVDTAPVPFQARPSSAAEELASPATGSTPRAAHKRSTAAIHLDPSILQSPGLPSSRSGRADSAAARSHHAVSLTRQPSVPTASASAHHSGQRTVAVIANSAKPKNRDGVPKPKARVGSDCSSAGADSGSSTRTQPLRFSEFQLGLEQRNRPSRKKLCKSEGSMWSEGQSSSLSTPSPTKPPMSLSKTVS